MHKLSAVAATTCAIASIVLTSGTATADGGPSSGGGGSSGTWPASLPLPTNPGTVLSQNSTKAVVRSTDVVSVVQNKLDNLYITQKGCIQRLGVNRPRDYLCENPATHKTDEVLFTFAALDPTAADPSRSQTNGFYTKG